MAASDSFRDPASSIPTLREGWEVLSCLKEKGICDRVGMAVVTSGQGKGTAVIGAYFGSLIGSKLN